MNFSGSVLIVDDENHIRKYVGLILKSLGVSAIAEASNGQEAIAAFERDRPDLVLLDVNMPQIDGIETLKRMKTIDPDCVVIMLTSVANRYTVEQTAELGATNYIRKDTPRQEIARALEETISSVFEPDEPAS